MKRDVFNMLFILLLLLSFQNMSVYLLKFYVFWWGLFSGVLIYGLIDLFNNYINEIE